jgi:hypothetical protein
MSTLDLSADELLTTTRSVRKRLDFSRPVAYTLGTDFKPVPRVPLESIVHWERW